MFLIFKFEVEYSDFNNTTSIDLEVQIGELNAAG